jgi:hypothetical protein
MKRTKEGVQELAKVTTAGYTQVAKKLGQLTATDVLQEGGQEALQQFIQNSGEQLWDKLTPAEKKKFGTDAFSPESFGEYISNGLAGLVGGAPTVFAYNKAKAVAKQETQANNAFELAKGGDEAINNFKANVDLAVKGGNMTKEEADNALLKVATYKQYYDQTKDTKLNDEQKKQVFGLTFEKAMLENEIPTEYEENKLNAIEQAKISVKKKQAKDIQAELDKIFMADELLRKETVSAKKTVEEADKHLSPEKPKEGAPKFAGSLKELYEKHSEDLGSLDVNPVKKEKKVEEAETRGFEEIPFADWNQKRDSQKFKVLSEHLDNTNDVQSGELKLMKGGDGQSTNDTVHIKLPNDKWVILASSATDKKTKLRGHLHIENLPDDFDGHKVVIKPTRLTTGRIVLSVYNGETGKHVGYVREDNTGKANEKLFEKRAMKLGADEATKIEEKEIEELQHLKTVKLTKNEIEATARPITQNQPSVKEVTPEVEKTQPKAEETVKTDSKEEFIADRIEALKADEGADFDPSLEAFYTKAFAEQYDKKNRPTEGDTITQEESTASDNTEVSGESAEVSPKKLRIKHKGVPRNKRKIIEPIRLKALEIEADTPYDLALQFFIKNGHVEGNDLLKYFKGDAKEKSRRWTLWNYVYGITRDEIANELWENNAELKYDTTDYLNAVEEVLSGFENRTDMAQDLVDRWKVKIDPRERMMSDELSKAENKGVGEQVEGIVEEAEKLGNDEITDLANDQDKFDLWGNPIIDIIRKKEEDEEGDVFSKKREGLSEMEQEVSDNLEKDLTENYEERKAQYKAKHGNIFDTDRAREFSSEYKELPQLLSGATQIPARNFVSKMYNEELNKKASEGQKNEVFFMAGGSGVGKSAMANDLHTNSQIIVDTNFSNYERAVQDINEALAHGKEVKIAFTYRNPVSSFIDKEGSVIHRMQREGRTVPFDVATYINQKALETIIKLSDHYKDNGKVKFTYFNNNFNKGEAKLISLNDVKDISYDFNKAKEKIKNEIERQYKSGEISPIQYYGITGQIQQGLSEARGLGIGSSKSLERRGSEKRQKIQSIEEVVNVLQKAIPNVKIVYDDKLDAAGKWSPANKTITINPYHAGKDTPIHEVGHILIDLMGGTNNLVIRNAIKQLKGTALWKEVSEHEFYSKLTEEEIGYEVLAEAIGREGAGIFDKEVEKSTFMKYLEYIYNRLKQLFGMDKEIAKSLAKQIIAGIGISKAGKTGGKEQFQRESESGNDGEESEKPKSAKKFKSFAEKTQAEQVRALTLSFDQYSEKVLKRNLIVESKDLEKVNEQLENPDLTEREQTIWESVKADLEARKKQDLRAWYEYREDMKWAVTLYSDINELEEQAQSGAITDEEFMDGMIELYNVVNGFQEEAKKAVEASIMTKLAYALFVRQKGELKKNDAFVEEVANKTDIHKLAPSLLNLSHTTEKTPELQALSGIFYSTALDMATESREKKNTYEKLGAAVIKEANKKLGISGIAQSIFSSDSAKYFDYLDSGNGELLTLNEAEAKNLSDAQINFLKYQRELIAEHKGMIVDDAVYNMPLQVLKTDPSFKEAFKQDGIIQAFSNFLGTNYNIKQVRIEYVNPNTDKTETTEFGNIEKAILDYGKGGAKEKAKALVLLLKYNLKAKKQLKKGVNVDEKENPLLVKNNSQFSMNNNGVLSSKFDKPRDKTRGYSKDFYRAGIEFIDDMMHVKHMSKIVPIANSIEYLNNEGYEEHEKKPNVVKWIQEWRDLHLFKNPKQITPEIDVALRFLRNLTSMTTMMYNIPAGTLNLFMGLYNNWRAENSEKVATGHARLFGKLGKHKMNLDYGLGTINPYAIDILRKFHVVSTDLDSNPKINIARTFTELGHALTRYGEFQIQGSMFLGLMTKEEYDSFEYKKNKQGIDELVFKDNITPAEQKALKEKFIAYKNRVSDIQGKYADIDRRNIMNGEAGKAAFTFKVWLPDFIRIRFGNRYIDANGKTKEGSWRTVTGEGLAELRKQIKENGGYAKGVKNTFFTNEENKSQEAKNVLSNLKGLMAVVFFWAMANQDDDDKKRKKTALDAQAALEQLLFVLNPNTLKWTVTRPVAAMGTVEKFINVADDVLKADADKLEKDIMKLIPANKALKIKEVFE